MSADNTYTARLERLRNRTLAIFHSRNPTARELGATPMDESTRQQRRLGQIRLVIQPPEGPAYEVAPCCPASTTCEPVCPIEFENSPGVGLLDLVDLSSIPFGFDYNQEQVNLLYGTPTPLPEPPVGYPFRYGLIVIIPTYCNATQVSIQLLDEIGNIVPASITNLGLVPPPGNEIASYVFVLYPTIDPGITSFTIPVTVSNSCSSSTGNAQFFCFLAGSPVTMADGTTKPIETVAVGDRVIGAFGEINTVTGTLSNNLGFVPITNINGEHKTTAPHPHIAADHKFCCTDPLTLTKFAYGRSFPLRGADGSIESRVIKGVNPDRITKLEIGTVLQTQTGPRPVTTLETIRMPATTRVYHLTTDGSHSYLVDGYAVAGGATEEDFDYDSWTPRA